MTNLVTRTSQTCDHQVPAPVQRGVQRVPAPRALRQEAVPRAARPDPDLATARRQDALADRLACGPCGGPVPRTGALLPFRLCAARKLPDRVLGRRDTRVRAVRSEPPLQFRDPQLQPPELLPRDLKLGPQHRVLSILGLDDSPQPDDQSTLIPLPFSKLIGHKPDHVHPLPKVQASRTRVVTRSTLAGSRPMATRATRSLRIAASWCQAPDSRKHPTVLEPLHRQFRGVTPRLAEPGRLRARSHPPPHRAYPRGCYGPRRR